MQRLSATDAMFLYWEDPAAHQHTLKISILDYSGVAGGYSFAKFRNQMAQRMHLLPPFRRRLLNTPLGLHRPVWIEDPDFDLDYHLMRVACPAPGGPKELGALIAQIATRQLDRDRPLWEVWMVEGLASGHVAAVAKVHHSVADGVSSAELLNNFYDTSPDAPRVTPEPWGAEQVPSKLTLAAKGLADVVRLWRQELPVYYRRAKEAREKIKQSGIKGEDVPQMFTAPHVPFNEVITPHRMFAYLTVSLDDAKAIRAALGGTINDVTLATVSGALRRYLVRRNALPKQPLVAAVPVSTRTPEERGLYGNRIAVMCSFLRTDIEEPGERYAAVREGVTTAKQYLSAVRGSRLEDWLEFFPPIYQKVTHRMMVKQKRAGGPSMFNLGVSNVTGPAAPLYLEGARLHAFYSCGQIIEGMGLNITMWSYVNQMNFSLLACKEAMPDLWDLAGDISEAFEELRKLAANRVGRAA